MKENIKKIANCLWIGICLSSLYFCAQLIGVVAGVIPQIVKRMGNSATTYLPVKKQIYEALTQNTNIIVFVMEIITAIAILSFAMYIYKGKFKKLLMVKKPLRLIPYMLIALSAYIAVSLLMTWIPWPQEWMQEHREATSIVMSGSNLFMTWLSTGFLAPFAEELMFRGIMISLMRKKAGKISAILCSSLMFGLIHGNMIQCIYAFLLGILFSSLNDREHSITPGLMAHIIFNTISVLMSGI